MGNGGSRSRGDSRPDMVSGRAWLNYRKYQRQTFSHRSFSLPGLSAGNALISVLQVLTWRWDEIKCVLNDDCDYPQAYKDGETPEEIWEGEMNAIYDSQ